MKRVMFLFSLILCISFVFTTALCQEQDLGVQEQENVPISSSMGADLVRMAQAQNNTVNLGAGRIQELFVSIDTRSANENDPSYALLNMSMDFVNIETGDVYTI